MEARLLERGKTSGRADDNAGAIQKRFATFRAETMPIVGYYAQLGAVHTCGASARFAAASCQILLLPYSLCDCCGSDSSAPSALALAVGSAACREEAGYGCPPCLQPRSQPKHPPRPLLCSASPLPGLPLGAHAPARPAGRARRSNARRIDGSQPVEDVYEKTQEALNAVHRADAARRSQTQVRAAPARAALRAGLLAPLAAHLA